jgi:hypothetical protein
MVPIENIMGRLGNKMFVYAYMYAQMRDGLIPDTYIQNEKYFKKYESDIKTLFGTDIGFLPYVSVHVRRTDYVNNSFYVDLLSTDYYQKAIALFPDKQFLVFSDDPAYCKTLEIFKGKQFQIMERGDEIEDMNLASSCEQHIIANSSFSWWYAYLSPAPSKKVIAPSVKNWYSDGIERTFCPEEWIRI